MCSMWSGWCEDVTERAGGKKTGTRTVEGRSTVETDSHHEETRTLKYM